MICFHWKIDLLFLLLFQNIRYSSHYDLLLNFLVPLVIKMDHG